MGARRAARERLAGRLAPAYLRWEEASVRTILTIHNIAYQGIFEKERLHRLGIPESAFDMYGVEFHNRLSFLKAGLFYADQVVAVSPSYAREITTKALGAGLHKLDATLAAEGRLTGILKRYRRQLGPRARSVPAASLRGPRPFRQAGHR